MIKYIIITLAILLVGIVGRLDYKDEITEENQYTRMVCQGAWPNYKDLNINCDQLGDKSANRN